VFGFLNQYLDDAIATASIVKHEPFKLPVVTIAQYMALLNQVFMGKSVNQDLETVYRKVKVAC
jgi:hypothetical protein